MRPFAVTIFLSAAMMTSCATAGRDVPDDPDVLLRPRIEVRAHTVVELLAAHLGVDMTPADSDGANPRKNSVEEIVEELVAAGLDAFAFRGSAGDGPTSLRHHLDRGRPVLLLLEGEASRRYWFLAVGYDADDDVVIGHDPSTGPFALDGKGLRELWTRTDHIAILAMPRTETGSGIE